MNCIVCLTVQIFSEHFEIGNNSFEQLCINFLNEKIREFSTERLITAELEWYKMDGLEVPHIDFLNNANIIGMKNLVHLSSYHNALIFFSLFSMKKIHILCRVTRA